MLGLQLTGESFIKQKHANSFPILFSAWQLIIAYLFFFFFPGISVAALAVLCHPW